MADSFFFDCEENDKFDHIIHKFQSHVVEVIILGGWLYTGKLTEIEDEQAILRDVTVTSSGGLTLSTFEVPKVAIALDSITSIGKPCLIGW